jgi:hypothetical protein
MVRAATFAVAVSMIKNPDVLLERGCSLLRIALARVRVESTTLYPI